MKRWLPASVLLSVVVVAQQPPAQPPVAPPVRGVGARRPRPRRRAPPRVGVAVRPIEPPATPLAAEAASAAVTRFSFIAYGDTRSSGEADVPGDGEVIHPAHTRIVEQM